MKSRTLAYQTVLLLHLLLPNIGYSQSVSISGTVSAGVSSSIPSFAQLEYVKTLVQGIPTGSAFTFEFDVATATLLSIATIPGASERLYSLPAHITIGSMAYDIDASAHSIQLDDNGYGWSAPIDLFRSQTSFYLPAHAGRINILLDINDTSLNMLNGGPLSTAVYNLHDHTNAYINFKFLADGYPATPFGYNAFVASGSVQNISVVPEISTFISLIAGLIALALTAKCRARQQGSA